MCVCVTWHHSKLTFAIIFFFFLFPISQNLISFFIFISGALNPSTIVEQLALNKLTGHEWFIQAACATTGEGIYEAMHQLATMVRKFKKNRSSYWNISEPEDNKAVILMLSCHVIGRVQLKTNPVLTIQNARVLVYKFSRNWRCLSFKENWNFNSVKMVCLLPKRGLLYKERICSQREQILSL